MPEIPFTQYIRPNGRKRQGDFERPQEVYDQAMAIIKAGYCFEIEELSTGKISMTISNGKEDVAIRICDNGPEVLTSIDDLVNGFYEDSRMV